MIAFVPIWLSNRLKFAPEACQTFENLIVVPHPVRRGDCLRLIIVYLGLERSLTAPPRESSASSRFPITVLCRASIERTFQVTGSWIR